MRLNTVNNMQIGLKQVDEFTSLPVPDETMTAIASTEDLNVAISLVQKLTNFIKLTKSSPQKFASLIMVRALRWPKNFCFT